MEIPWTTVFIVDFEKILAQREAPIIKNEKNGGESGLVDQGILISFAVRTPWDSRPDFGPNLATRLLVVFVFKLNKAVINIRCVRPFPKMALGAAK